MNRLPGIVAFCESSDHLSLVDVEVAGDLFTAIVVETPDNAPWLNAGSKVWVFPIFQREAVIKRLCISLSSGFQRMKSRY